MGKYSPNQCLFQISIIIYLMQEIAFLLKTKILFICILFILKNILEIIDLIMYHINNRYT